MKSFYQSYVRAFIKFAQSEFDNSRFLKTLSRFALIISEKANELIARAAKNSRIDLEKLQKEIFQLGNEFMHKFADKLRLNRRNNPINIAIADDHNVFKQGMETVLGSFPEMNLMMNACNGRDLLEQIKSIKPDVVLLDLRMPVMDGLATLQELKKLYNIKVIMLSADGNDSDIQHALRMGAHSYLLKSSDPMAICRAIRESCNPGVFS